MFYCVFYEKNIGISLASLTHIVDVIFQGGLRATNSWIVTSLDY